MFLSESLVWALGSKNSMGLQYPVSGVKIYCDDAEKDDLMYWLDMRLSFTWKHSLESQIYRQEDKDRNVYPISIDEKNYGLLIKIQPLILKYCYGDFYSDIEYLFDESLVAALLTFPNIHYEGFLCYPLHDLHYGFDYQREISSTEKHPDMLYDFVGEELNKILSNKDTTYSENFWDTLYEELESREDYEETINSLMNYSKWINSEALDKTIAELKEAQKQNSDKEGDN